MLNPWDKLAGKFDTKPGQPVDSAAADNVMILWPPTVEQVKKHFPDTSGLSAVDFGCGSGGFAGELRQMGFNTLGIDSAPEMIALAQKNYPEIRFAVGSAELLPARADLIVSIMVLQFIEDAGSIISMLVSVLVPDGLLIFAVQNPEYVVAHQKAGTKKFPEGKLVLDGVAIPIFIRTAKEYDAVLQKHGMKKVFEVYPPFTEEYLSRYPKGISSVSEYLILAYKK